MKVMSLFDGMSCGQIALKKLGAKVDTYYASEIDKYAIKVAKEKFNKNRKYYVSNLSDKDIRITICQYAGMERQQKAWSRHCNFIGWNKLFRSLG